MNLNTTVLVNSINNLSDARFCAGMGVDMLGFSLEPSQQDYVAPDKVKEMAGWVAGVKPVGEFDIMPTHEINELAQELKLEMVQLNRPYLLNDMEELTIPVIQKVMIHKDTTEQELLEMLELYQPNVAYFLIDSNDFTVIDDTLRPMLKKIAKQFPILIGFGIEKDSVKDMLQKVKPAGLSLKGGQEIRPGFKDFDELQDIFDVLEEV